MPRPFPAKFGLRAVVLVRAGKTITATAAELVARCSHYAASTGAEDDTTVLALRCTT